MRTLLRQTRINHIFRKSEELQWPRPEYQIPNGMRRGPLQWEAQGGESKSQQGKESGVPGGRLIKYIGIDPKNKHVKGNGSQISLCLCSLRGPNVNEHT